MSLKIKRSYEDIAYYVLNKNFPSMDIFHKTARRCNIHALKNNKIM